MVGYIAFLFVVLHHPDLPLQISEYWLVRRGHQRIADLYTTRRDGWYWYTYGVNWRAYVAYISGIAINVVGFAGAVGTTVPLAATRIYELSFFTGFGVSSVSLKFGIARASYLDRLSPLAHLLHLELLLPNSRLLADLRGSRRVRLSPKRR